MASSGTRLVFGADCETSGLAAESDHILEIAGVLWDMQRGRVVKAGSWAIQVPGGFEPSPAIQELNHLDPALLALGAPIGEVLEILAQEAKGAEAVVMFNGLRFDDHMLQYAADRAAVPHPFYGLPLIDPMVDCPFPARITTRNLEFLAASHGFLNPFPHAALGDTLSMLRLLQEYSEHLDAMLERAKSPHVMAQAMVSKENKDLAKDRFFHWNPESFNWTKAGRLVDFENPAEPFPFKLKIEPYDYLKHRSPIKVLGAPPAAGKAPAARAAEAPKEVQTVLPF